MLLGKTFAAQDRSVERFREPEPRAGAAADPPGDGRPLVLHDHRHDLLDHAGVRVLAGGHAGRQRRRRARRPPATSWRSRRSRAACSSRSASCSTSRSRSRARSRCSTGSSSTSTSTPRSRTPPTRWRWSPATVRGAVALPRACRSATRSSPAPRRRSATRRRRSTSRRTRRSMAAVMESPDAGSEPARFEVVDGGRADEPPPPFGLEDVSFEAKPGRAGGPGRVRRARARRRRPT